MHWNKIFTGETTGLGIMPECDGCGSHVTENYYRVFAVDGDLPACIHCASNREAREAGLRQQ